eukprot:2551394-Alexandrium_andersonii.AAC.1
MSAAPRRTLGNRTPFPGAGNAKLLDFCVPKVHMTRNVQRIWLILWFDIVRRSLGRRSCCNRHKLQTAVTARFAPAARPIPQPVHDCSRPCSSSTPAPTGQAEVLSKRLRRRTNTA